MLGPYTRETIENWVSDFVHSDAGRDFPSGLLEFAPEILKTFLLAACEARQVEPADIEEPDLRTALLEKVARLNLPAGVRTDVPALCAGLLAWLETEGRLGGGRVLGAFVRALREPFNQAATGKTKPFTHAGSAIGRNDPCPCGSGRKYKKCCARD